MVAVAQISNSPNEPYLWKTNSFGPLSMNNFESHVPSAESMARDMGSHLSTRLGEHSSSGSTADSALLDNPMPWDLFDTMDYTMTPTTSHHSDTIDPLAFDFSYNSGVESYQDRSDTPTMLTEEDMRTSYQQSLQHHHHQQMHTQWDVPRTGSQPQAATVAPSDTTHGSVKLEAAGTEFSYSLSHAERMRPTAIALLATKATAGNHDESGSTEASPKSSTATNNAADQTQSPAVSPTSSRRASNQIPKRSMRKESTHSSSASGSNSNHSTTKTTHNMIEKRYRTNLNDKIAALRDSVPSLRVAAARVDLFENGGKVQPSQQEDLGGLTPANKLNKVREISTQSGLGVVGVVIEVG